MNRSFRYLAALAAALALSSALFAKPPGPGSRHIRFTGTETMTDLGENLAYFTVEQVISIPSLHVDDYVLIMDMTTTHFVGLSDGVYMAGTGFIMSPDGSEVIGASSFLLRTQALPGPEAPWAGIVTLAGVFWSGPLGGLAISEKIDVGGTSDPWMYGGVIDGNFEAAEFVDMKALKDGLADFIYHHCRHGKHGAIHRGPEPCRCERTDALLAD